MSRGRGDRDAAEHSVRRGGRDETPLRRHVRRHGVARVLGWTAASATALFMVAAPSGPAQAAFSGQNGQIVFDTIWTSSTAREASQIYSARPDGGGRHQLDQRTGARPRGTRLCPRTPDASPSAELAGQQRPGLDHAGRRLAPACGGRRAGVGRRRPQLHQERPPPRLSRCGNYVGFFFTCKIDSVRLDGRAGKPSSAGGGTRRSGHVSGRLQDRLRQ